MSKTNSAHPVAMALLHSKLMSYIPDGSQFPLSNTLGLFLEILDQDTWNDMDDGVSAFVEDSTGDLYPGLRVLVTLSDGTVAYDTKSANNTYLAFSTKNPKAINENHNSRLAILTALMSNAGTGYEKKYSYSNGQDQVYYAVRMGSSPQHALGVVRVSVYANNNDGSRGDNPADPTDN